MHHISFQYVRMVFALTLDHYYRRLIGAVANQETRKTIGYCFENNRLYCFPNPRWRLEKSDQSGGELRIQDGGAHESRPCWKTTHQSQQRTGIGLTDFHSDTSHARIFAKMSRNFKIHVTNFDK